MLVTLALCFYGDQICTLKCMNYCYTDALKFDKSFCSLADEIDPCVIFII